MRIRSAIRTALRATLAAPAGARRLAVDVAAIRRLVDDPTYTRGYFAGAPRKSRARVLADLLAWRVRRGEVNEYYYCWGMDRADAPPAAALLSYREFRALRDGRNAPDRESGLDYIALMRDKYLFALLLKALGHPTPPLLALVRADAIEWLDPRRTAPLASLCEVPHDLDAFCKPRFGIQGAGVFRLQVTGGVVRVDGEVVTIDDLAARVGANVLQVPIVQHSALAELHPSSVNTLRVITVRDRQGARTFSRPLLRVGFGGSVVDNGNAGGLQGFVDPATGRVTGPGIMLRGGTLARHPDTGIPFDGFAVPFFDRALDMAVRLHQDVPGLHSIGWDLAITPDGPVFVEGNDNWAAGLRIGLEAGFREEFVGLCATP